MSNSAQPRFLFRGHRRKWNPLKGHTPPSEEVYVVKSLPGNVVGWGLTEKEAVRDLLQTLQQCVGQTGSEGDRWYEEAMKRLTEPERKLLLEAYFYGRSKPESANSLEYRVDVGGGNCSNQLETA